MKLVDPEALFEEVLPERGQLLAVPLANAVEGFVRDRVESFIGSDRFERLWEGAVEVAHQTAVRVLEGESDVVTAEDGSVTLNLIPVIDAVLADITSRTPEILGRQVDIPDVSVEDIPEAAIAPPRERPRRRPAATTSASSPSTTTGSSRRLQDAIDLFNKLVVVLLPLAVVAAAAALWVSRRRRRTLLQLAAGVVLGMVVLRRGSFALEGELESCPPRARASRRPGPPATPSSTRSRPSRCGRSGRRWRSSSWPR